MSGEHEEDVRVPIETKEAEDNPGEVSSPSMTRDLEGLTPKEASAVRRVRGLSQLLDEAFRIPGTNYRVGLDPVLGIVPGAGDALAALASLYPILEAYRFGATKLTLAKMLILVGIDMVIGSVPLLGPGFDALWKANKWNLRTLEREILREGGN